jgi:hypothetical protein
MEKELQYRSTIKSKPFLYNETKKVASLVMQGFKDIEIKNKAVDENIFMVNTETRRKEIASTALNRLKLLNEYLLDIIANGSIEKGKQVAIYSIMKTDRLFFEFMDEVFREKLIIKDMTLADKDFNIFFDRKKEQSNVVASWDEYTYYKLKQVYIRVLTEAGFIKNHKDEREIIKPLVDDDLISHLKLNGDSKYLRILLGEVE